MADDGLAKAIHGEIETCRVTTDPMWEKATWDELPEWYQAALVKGAQAATRYFFGADHKGTPPKDSGKLLVEAVRGLLQGLEYQQRAERAPNPKYRAAYTDLIRIEKDKAQAALRAAGEEGGP